MQGDAVVVENWKQKEVANKMAGAQLLAAYLAMQPEWQKALMDIAEVYAERFPLPMSMLLV